ncbi:hypothetical protein F2P79_010961 [Pimephales promelas]|nr:hypothetical protein F2P79_010961 [Pimephales promelas]
MLLDLYIWLCSHDDLSVSFKITVLTRDKHTHAGGAHAEAIMLYIVGIVLGLIGIIKCMSHGLSQRMNDQELHLIVKLLSVGLVDADPNTLHHIKEYRDLRGSST